MKTLFKLLMWTAMLLPAFAGYSQCSAEFGIGNGGNGPGNVEFADSLYIWSYNDSSIQFTWTFGDGTDTTTLFPSISHHYANSGVYTICLTVVDTAHACTVQQCNTDTVNLCAGAAQFTYVGIGFGDDSFFVGLGAGYTGAWNFGDGSTANALSISHQYNSNGNYNVCFTVTGPGCADSFCEQNNVIICQSFYPGFAVTPVSYNPYTAAFVADDPNALYTYQWEFGDGTTGSGSSIIHSYNHNGYDSVILVVSYNGCIDSNIHAPLYVDRCGLNASVYEGSNGLFASFGVTIEDSTGNTPITNLWSFPGGNPATSTNASITVTYTTLGTYTDTLYVSTSTGCVDTFAQSFTLTPGSYSISGEITAGNDTAEAWVYLIVQDSIGHLALLDSTGLFLFSDSGNVARAAYSFNGLPTDSYYVKAALFAGSVDYANYLPTYYTNSLSWVAATPVYVGPNTAGGVNISLTPGTNPGGPGFVGGYVSQGAGLVLQQGGGGNLTRGVGDALAGVQINLLTVNNDAVAYTFTDVNGQYQFSNLAYGSYYIYAEQLNKIPVHIPFTLSPSDSSITNLNLSINSDSATAINDVNGITIQGIYPNPVFNNLEIQLSSRQTADVTVKLIDILGRTIISNNTKLTVGDNHLEMDMENLAAGVYQLLIQTNNQHLTWQVVKAK